MIVAAVERIEAVVEAAQPDGVERQRRHVVDDVDFLVGVEPLPFLHELLGDIDHARMVGRHRAVAERLQQDVVRLAPVRLIGVGGKQAIAADGANAAQRTAHRLVETLFVGEFVDQIVAANNDERRAHHVEPEDRPQFLGEPNQMLHRCVGIQRQHVADDRLFRRMRYRTQFVGGRHLGRVSLPNLLTLSFRGGAKHRTRNLEIPGLRCAHPGMTARDGARAMTTSPYPNLFLRHSISLALTSSGFSCCVQWPLSRTRYFSRSGMSFSMPSAADGGST